MKIEDMNPSFKISKADQEWIRKVISLFHIKKVLIETSESKKKHPDIWCFPGAHPPKVVVTREWLKQSAPERRKRLAHELVGHIVFKWPHNAFMDRLGFSTYPKKDKLSWMIYQDIQKGIRRPGRYYIDKAMMGEK